MTTLRILGMDWELRLVGESPPHPLDLPLPSGHYSVSVDGRAMLRDLTITMNNTMAPQKMAQMLFHEILHASCDHIEESEVESLTDRFWAALRDNGLLNEQRWAELVGGEADGKTMAQIYKEQEHEPATS